MYAIAFGSQSPCGPTGIACGQSHAGCFCFGDSCLRVFESQMALFGARLLGPILVESMEQPCHQVILTLDPGALSRHFKPHDQKSLLYFG
ncbi:hypothetical protein GC209_00630 [bacterium]|nr:hypothetical protein [bacterium]